MSIVDLMTVLGFGLTCFSVGFMLGSSNINAKK